ncbi:MAG: hypothetical protein ACTHU0_23055 [Kofleriaceae bacterium]
MLLALIVLTALGTLSGLTVVSVQGGIATTGNDRFHAMAVYAAESGGAVALDHLRKQINLTSGWTALVTPNNDNPVSPNMPGNNVRPGQPGNLFNDDMQGWYSVQILNNRSDPKFAVGEDDDDRVIIRSTGYGPNGAIAVIEWEISGSNVTGLGRPCPGYGQKGMSEDGAGRNDCLGTINTADTATLRPGG